MYKILIFVLIFVSISFSKQDSVKTFYANGKIKSSISYLDSIRNGEARFYFENGNLKEKLSYDNGKVNGLVSVYNEDGKLKETFNIEDGVRQGPTSVYDSNGVYVADINYDNGKKVVKSQSSYNSEDVLAKARKEKYEKLWQAYYMKRYELGAPEAIIKNFYETDPAYFLTAEKMPEPVGGMDALQQKLKYPEDAKKEKIEGEVRILAFVKRDGSVLKADVIQGLSKSCDEEAKNLILNAKFIPGRIHDDPVNVQMVVPVNFNLNTAEAPPKLN